MQISIIQAQYDQAAVVSGILTEAALWMMGRGEEMWELEEVSEEGVRGDVGGGRFYLAWEGREAVGVMKLQMEDKFFWPRAREGEAVYLHRLAVRRAWAGRGVPGAMFDLAAGKAREMGREFLRLDCDAGRAGLRRMYERHGFGLREVFEINGYFNALYERRVDGVG